MNKLKVGGMHCQNCVKAVTEAVSALPGAKGVQVSLEKGEVDISGGIDSLAYSDVQGHGKAQENLFAKLFR